MSKIIYKITVSRRRLRRRDTESIEQVIYVDSKEVLKNAIDNIKFDSIEQIEILDEEEWNLRYCDY